MDTEKLEAAATYADGPSYQEAINQISRGLTETRDAFLKIGWHLKYIKDNELYKEEGYKNIYDFAEKKFHLSQPSTSRFIKVCKTFSVGNDSYELDEKYKEFNQSQLIEMGSMEPEDRESITPEMSVKTIQKIKREIKKEKSANPADSAEQDSYATSHINDTAALLSGKAVAQPLLPKLKNDAERKKWLKNIGDWPLWYEDPNINVRYYKYNFEDGSKLVVTKYRMCEWSQKDKKFVNRNNASDDADYGFPKYHMLFSENYLNGRKPEYGMNYQRYYNSDETPMSMMVKFLKDLQKGNNA